MKRYLLTYATVFAVAAGVAAQTPPPTSQAPTQPQTATAQAPPATVTVEGCLLREQDVPRREPNIAERAGIREDYVLANAKVIKGTAPKTVASAGQTRPGEPATDVAKAGQTGATQTSNMQPMYDVKELDSDRLKPLVGKRVQIEGTWADLERNESAGPTEDLIDIKGLTIREVAGTCPAKP